MPTSMARRMPNRAILVTPPRRARGRAGRVSAFVMRADPPLPGEGEVPEFLQFTFSGLTVGAVYALVALGFTLIYNASDVINFAQGEFVMLGGMTTVFLALAGVPLPLAAGLAIVATIIVGLALYRFAIEPARGANAVVLIIITIGASIFLRGAAQVVFDKRFHSLPPWFGSDPIRVGGAAIPPQSLVG